jgi:phosphotransferase system enzyme I (PtsI)
MSPEGERDGGSVIVKGAGVSPGVVIGPALLLVRENIPLAERAVPEGEAESEIARFENALIATRGQIRRMKKELESRAGPSGASVFDAHLMVLDDRTLIEDIILDVRTNKRNVEVAVRDVCERYAKVLGSVQDEYLRERVADLRDVSRRVIRNLGGDGDSRLTDPERRWIVVANDLTPSETVAMRKESVIGFATDGGSSTSHTALMARALEIPAVVGLHDVTTKVRTGDEVLLDGNRGVVIVKPSPAQLEEYGRVAEVRRMIQRDLGKLRDRPAVTTDGRRIVLAANAEGLDDIEAIRAYGAEGVGLLRTEYLYLERSGVVDEDEQAKVYGEMAARLSPATVVIRTLDLGGDKYFPDGEPVREENPFLGCRSIRLSLMYPAHFKAQLRAVLRASSGGNVKVMYPMICNVDEVKQANLLLEEAKADLRSRGVPFDENIQTGVMIEIPGAALIAGELAKYVRFFSIGTNDLIQYTLAVDRVNDRVSYLYQPTHPAILDLLHRTVEAAHANGVWVGVCGEMAADPLMAPILVGLGVDGLSVAPSAVPMIKDAICGMEYNRAREVAAMCRKMPSAGDVRKVCVDEMRRIAPELLELV